MHQPRWSQRFNQNHIDLFQNELYNCTMDMVADASAILAVLMNEPEREKIIALTQGCAIAAPGCLQFEIGNALSAMLKRSRISSTDAVAVYHAYMRIPMRELTVDIPAALLMADTFNIYAYDAYYLSCAERYNIPLLTLDAHMAKLAGKRNISVVEV
ncbi:type II toxin-antitoxin system VapC family toxin [Spirochaeta dissipatitropha]